MEFNGFCFARRPQQLPWKRNNRTAEDLPPQWRQGPDLSVMCVLSYGFTKQKYFISIITGHMVFNVFDTKELISLISEI